MNTVDFCKRLDATIAGKPDETSAPSSEPLHEAYAAFHGIATPIPRCRPAAITVWFVEYDSLFSPKGSPCSRGDCGVHLRDA